MNVVRDCPAARWLPTRHRFALTRLFAFLRGRGRATVPNDVDRLLLAIDRDQSAAENYMVTLWLLTTATFYVMTVLPLPVEMAIIVALPAAAFILQALFCIHGVVWNLLGGTSSRNNVKLNSVFLMTTMFLASAYFATLRSPVRYVAWFFFAVAILNGAASAIMFLLRDSVRELERECGI
jgi:hypothetical protein